MKEPKKKTIKSLEDLQELGKKYGVQVTDMADRGVRVIGILGGVRRQDQELDKGQPPADSARGAF